MPTIRQERDDRKVRTPRPYDRAATKRDLRAAIEDAA